MVARENRLGLRWLTITRPMRVYSGFGKAFGRQIAAVSHTFEPILRAPDELDVPGTLVTALEPAVNRLTNAVFRATAAQGILRGYEDAREVRRVPR